MGLRDQELRRQHRESESHPSPRGHDVGGCVTSVSAKLRFGSSRKGSPPPDTPKWLLPRDARRPAFLIRAGFVSSRFSFSAVLPVSPSAGIQTFITSCVGGKAGAELGMGRGLWGLSAHYAVFLQVNIQHLRARQWRGVGRRPSGEAGCPFIAVPFIRAPSTAAAQGGTGAAPRPT